jgi:alpha-beta hydrolase superfamily lysophospholipase
MPDATNKDGSPTVVLVHGALADASSWNGVIERLQGKGVQVKAPANPLRGIANDSALTRRRAPMSSEPRRSAPARRSPRFRAPT